MKFYVVGFGERRTKLTKHLGFPVLGDMLVYAFNGRDALDRVREVGLVPNPGDIFVLGSDKIPEEVVVEPWMLPAAEQSSSGIQLIWSTKD